MAFPTSVNSQVTDSDNTGTTNNDGFETELLGEIIRALGIASQREISVQNQAKIIKQAASITGISLLETD